MGRAISGPGLHGGVTMATRICGLLLGLSVIGLSNPAAGAVTGACGTANGKNYPFEFTGFFTDTLCSAGTPSGQVVFPAVGNAVTWKCAGTATSADCSASHGDGLIVIFRFDDFSCRFGIWNASGQPGVNMLAGIGDTVAKTQIPQDDAKGNKVLDELISHGIVEDISATKVRVLPSALDATAVRNLAGDDFDVVWAVLQQSSGIKANFGFCTMDLDPNGGQCAGDPAYLTFIRAMATNPNFEIWFHCYDGKRSPRTTSPTGTGTSSTRPISS